MIRGCPVCGETDDDWLTWAEDEQAGVVECQSCGAVYVPDVYDSTGQLKPIAVIEIAVAHGMDAIEPPAGVGPNTICRVTYRTAKGVVDCATGRWSWLAELLREEGIAVTEPAK